jgi:hypothetical protein
LFAHAFCPVGHWHWAVVPVATQVRSPPQRSPHFEQLSVVLSGKQLGPHGLFAGHAQLLPWQVCGASHVTPQAPQLPGVPIATQSPLAFLHGLSGGHAQTPAWQVCMPLHATPQAPQF